MLHWPNLRPYNTKKCLDPSAGRVYISRDIVFDEHVFSFAHLHQNAGSRLRAKLAVLPNSLLNPSTSYGDAILLDHSASKSPCTNTNSSCTSVVDDIGLFGVQNGAQIRPNGCDFMCSVASDTPSTDRC
jgi:hypothetical protein